MWVEWRNLDLREREEEDGLREEWRRERAGEWRWEREREEERREREEERWEREEERREREEERR